MNDTRVELPEEIDINIPNVARVYDFLLGGAHNFPSDRRLADMVERTMVGARDIVRLNRSFLRRAVHFMIDAGIRQFLDLGSGIPTVGNVHEIAQVADPACRVVYVDKDPVAVAHSRLLLRDNGKATVIRADVRDPERILGHPETRGLLNFDEPVGLLTLLLWHFLPDSEDPLGLLARYRDRLAPGSFLGLTHLTYDGKPPGMDAVVDEVRRSGADAVFPRPYEQIVEMFAGFELVDPGVVTCATWRPAGPGDYSPISDANTLFYAGIGRRPDALELDQ